MQPEPLIWMPPYVVFDYAGKTLRIFANVSYVVTGANEFDCGFKAKPVFAELFVPVKKPRDHGGIGM
jgi:hypothetical protein